MLRRSSVADRAAPRSVDVLSLNSHETLSQPSGFDRTRNSLFKRLSVAIAGFHRSSIRSPHDQISKVAIVEDCRSTPSLHQYRNRARFADPLNRSHSVYADDVGSHVDAPINLSADVLRAIFSRGKS